MKPNDTRYGTFGFRFPENPNLNVQLDSFGWDRKEGVKYEFDGRNRIENERILVQCTLSGWGILELPEQTFKVDPSHTFLVNIPDSHKYYLPKESSHWEFVYVMLYGEEAQKWYRRWVNEYGNLLKISSNSNFVSCLKEIYQTAMYQTFTDPYQTAAMAYRCLMELQRTLRPTPANSSVIWPEVIEKSIIYMQKHYPQDISLDMLAEVSGLSKFRFAHLFSQVVGETPIQYLSRIRLGHALKLLRHSDASMERIAVETGFRTAAYFSRVFKNRFGMAPNEFRRGKRTIPFDDIIF